MTKKRSSGKSPRQAKQDFAVLKPNGKIDEAVQRVGPRRFGVVSVDCAKARSMWMLTDFFGNVLVPPQIVKHSKADLLAMVEQVRAAETKHRLREMLVAVERTGNYHLPVQRAFRQAGYQPRTVHPFATKQFREADKCGDKTDENDLAAIFRAAIVGFALVEEPLPEPYRPLQLLIRHRRDLVKKSSALRCQIREQMHQLLPGYAELFGDHFFERPAALALPQHFASAAAFREAGAKGLSRVLEELGISYQQRLLFKILAWAENAPPAASDAVLRQRVLADLLEDWQQKARKIAGLELDAAALLAQTPYVRLMVVPGMNAVSVADLAGELGPITRYANPNAITGRAGLYPSRYQSDRTDRQGRLVTRANKRLRRALLQAADNLIVCNNYYKGFANLWRSQEVDPRLIRVRIGKRFSRLLLALVAGDDLVPHPCCRDDNYVLAKLGKFLLEHQASPHELRNILLAATAQLPAAAHAREADALKRQMLGKGRRGVTHISQALLAVVARLLGEPVEDVLESTNEDRTSS